MRRVVIRNLLLTRGAFGPLPWQAEADTEGTLSASPAAVVGPKASALAKRRCSLVPNSCNWNSWRTL